MGILSAAALHVTLPSFEHDRARPLPYDGRVAVSAGRALAGRLIHLPSAGSARFVSDAPLRQPRARPALKELRAYVVEVGSRHDRNEALEQASVDLRRLLACVRTALAE
jgi:hypothetical protein